MPGLSRHGTPKRARACSAPRAAASRSALARALHSRWRLIWPVAVAALAGCAQPVRVNTLATGQPDRLAYELFGPSLADLRAQASQLCPQGGDIVRASESRQVNSTSPLPAMRWAEDKTSRLLPAPGTAQLVVTCDAPGRQLLAALPPPAPAASAATTNSSRKPLFKLGGDDGPGLFSRLGGAVAGWWPGTSDAAKHAAKATDGPDKSAPVAAGPSQKAAPPKPRAPVPVTGYDD